MDIRRSFLQIRKNFYYEDWEVSPDGEKSSTVWRYDIEKSKEEVLLKKEEIQGAEEESSIRLIGIREDGIYVRRVMCCT